MPGRIPRRRRERKPEGIIRKGTIDWYHRETTRLSEKFERFFGLAVKQKTGADMLLKQERGKPQPSNKRIRQLLVQKHRAYQNILKALDAKVNAFISLRDMVVSVMFKAPQAEKAGLQQDIAALNKIIKETSAFINALNKDLKQWEAGP